MSAAPPAIEVRDVCKSHGATQVLRSIDLVVPQGAVTAVLGASGSGKTTLLRLIAGFDTVDTGSLSIAGRLVDDGRSTVRAQHRGIGYVPQDAALFPHLSVLANVGFGVRRRDRSRVADLLALVGLSGYEHRYPHQLSGGQQQRVALARALAVQPAVVLLDEPFSSLDAALRETVRADTARILADTRTTTVLVTHDQDEALSLAHHLVLIDAGRVTASGSPHDLYEHPPTPDVAAAIGVANIIPGHAAGDLVRSPLGDLTTTARPSSAPTGTPCHVLVRPEQLRLTTEPDARGVTARLHRIRYLGHDTLVELVIDAGHRGDAMHLTARVPGRSAAQPGQLVGVTVLGDVHVWA